MKECADRKQVKTEIGHEFPQQDHGSNGSSGTLFIGSLYETSIKSLVTFSTLFETNCMKNNRCGHESLQTD